MMASASQVFCPYRAIGFCCNHVPLAIQTKGTDTLAVTAVGRSFHVYMCDRLRLIFVGSVQSHPLQCLALHGNSVFAAYRNVIKSFKRGKEVNCYHGHEGEVHTLLPFGEHLVSIDDKNSMKIWHVPNNELYGELQFDDSSFEVTTAMHPSTYLNKILLASRQGQLQLWNIRTNKLVYTFAGWGSPVVSVVQSPAVDVVGVGLESGGVVMHNLRYDETIVRFQQDWGPVTTLSFRSDGINMVASGSPLGHIAVWDLDNRRLGTVIRDAHNGSVTGMEFLQSQPLLVTSGPDNSLKMWIFDQSDGSGRLLRSRCGHSAPPTKIRFCTKGGLGILSAGLDNSLRSFAVNRDIHLNVEFSQGSLTKKSRVKGVKVETLKLPSIKDFASEYVRVHEWDSIVTCHTGHDSAHTWHFINHCIGKHALTSRHVGEGARPQCVTVSPCGNFAIIGMSTGHIEMFNMQSGIHRGEFGRPKAHSRSVRGIAVDAVNMEVFSGSGDSTLKFWSFHEKKLIQALQLESPVSSMVYNRDSSMLGVACDDFIILIVDTDTRRIVRSFTGHSNRITDMAFSPDSRWLVSSAMDCSVRTWDLPSGRLIDSFLVESPATSLTFSPTADFLASTHVDDLGIYLWTNKTLYSHVSLRPLPSHFTPSTIHLPTTALPEGDANREEESAAEGTSDAEKEEAPRQEDHSAPLSEGLVTLSNLPKSRWHNLSQLDIIKQHNKPVDPPKQLKPPPFFLPTIPGLQPKFVPTEEDIPAEEAASGSKILNLGKLQPLSEFQKCLQDCAATSKFDPLMELLKTMNPSAIDSEFHSLGPEAGGSTDRLVQLMECLLQQLKTNRNFELVEAYLGLFLKLHASSIPQSPEMVSLAEQLLTEHQKTWKRIQTNLNTSACILNYCKSATI